MGIVFDVLAEQKALRTLANAQSTCSSIYILVTGSLYRHIDITDQQAISLFGLFDVADRRPFSEPVPCDIHLLDLNICHRLRANFAYAKKLTLTIHPGQRGGAHLDAYLNTVMALKIFQHPTFWPAMERAEIDMSSLKEIAYPDTCLYDFSIPSAVLRCLETKVLVVTFPSGIDRWSTQSQQGFAYLSTFLSRPNVDAHVEINNHGVWSPRWLAAARHLTIRFPPAPSSGTSLINTTMEHPLALPYYQIPQYSRSLRYARGSGKTLG
jgi:hypothetical protein